MKGKLKIGLFKAINRDYSVSGLGIAKNSTIYWKAQKKNFRLQLIAWRDFDKKMYLSIYNKIITLLQLIKNRLNVKRERQNVELGKYETDNKLLNFKP